MEIFTGGTKRLHKSLNVSDLPDSKYSRAIVLNRWMYNVPTKIARIHGLIVLTKCSANGATDA